LTLWTLLIAAILGAMLLPPTADAAATCTITWTGAAGTTAWATPGNWDLNRAPAPEDYVCVPDMMPDITLTLPAGATLRGIDASEAITINNTTLNLTDATADSHLRGPVKISGATLIDGAGNLHLYGTVDWDNGTIGGAGTLTVEPGAALNLLTATVKDLKRNTINRGTVSFTGTGAIRAATITLTNEGTILLPGAGTFSEAAAATFTLQNNGTIQKTGTSEIILAGTLVNGGALEVSGGILTLPKASTFLPASTTTVTGQLKLTGAHTWEGTAIGTGLVSTKDTASLTLTAATTSHTVPTEITASGKLVAAGTAFVKDLTLSGGTIEGSGDLTVSGTFAWKSGTVQGAGKLTIAAGAQMTLTTFAVKTQKDRTIENLGTVNWTDGTFTQSSATLINAGTFNVVGTRSIAPASTTTVGRLQNTASGTITKTGTGSAVFDTLLENDGKVVVGEGTLSRKSSGEAGETGEYSVAAGAVLEYTAGTHALSGLLTGAGKVLVAGGTVTATGAWEIATTELTGGALNFDAPSQIQTLRLVGNATLGGTANRQIIGSMEWTQGNVAGTGALTIAEGVTLSITGTAGRTLTAPLENHGTVTVNVSSFTVTAPGVLTNYGNLLLQNSATIDYSYTVAKLVNYGTITRDAGAKMLTLDGTIENHGTIVAVSGTLGLKGNVTDSASATLRAEAGAAIYFAESTKTSTLTGSVTGGGTVTVHNAQVTFAGPYSVANTRLTGNSNYPTIWTGTPALPGLEIASGEARFDVAASVDTLLFLGGNRAGTGELTVTKTFSWQAGYLMGAGSTVIGPGALGEITNNSSRELRGGHTLTNKGSIAWKSGGITFREGVVFNNEGVLEMQADVTFSRSQGTLDADLKLNNRGTITKTGGTGTASVRGTFDNKGTVSVASGTLQFDATHSADESGRWIAQGGGTLLFAGTTTRTLGGEVSGTGTIETDAGTTYFNGPVTVGTFKQDGGTTYLSGTPAATLFHMTGGTATINGDLTAATLKLDNGSTILNVPAGRTVTIAQGLLWNGGTLQGAGTTTLAVGSQSIIEPTGGKNLRGSHTLQNQGTLRMRGGFSTGEGAILNNAGTTLAEADFKIERIFGVGALAQWNNTGTFRKTAGSGRTEIAMPFDNDGTVEALFGTLAFITGTGGPGEAAGTFAATGTLEFDGTHTFAAQATISGTGTFRVLGGTATMNGAYDVATTEVIGSSTIATFKGATATQHISVYGASPKAIFEAQVSPLTVSVAGSGGNATFKQNLSPVRVDLGNGGTLDLQGATMTVSQQFNWTGGVLKGVGGTARVSSGAEWLLSSAAGKYMEDGIHVINQGAATWTDGTFEYAKGPTLTNEGLFDVRGDLTLKREYYGSGAALQINNKGTFRKSAGAGTAAMYAGFDNDGAVDVQTGTLGLLLGSGGSDETGTFTVNGTLDLAADINTSHNLAASSIISGPGVLRATGAVVNVAGAVNVSKVEVTSGTATFSGPVTTPAVSVTGGTLNLTQDLTTASFSQSGGTIAPANLTVTSAYRWTAGISAGTAGTTLIPPGAQMLLETTNQKSFYGPRTLRNEGTITYSGAGLYHGSNPFLENAGTFDITADGAIDGPYGCCSEWKTTNTGTIVKSGGTGTSKLEIVLTTPGSIRVLSGIMHIDDRFPAFAGNSTTGGPLTSGSYEVAAGSSFRVSNLFVTENLANVALTGPGATFTNQTGNGAFASLQKNSGSLTVSGGAQLTLPGTGVTNTGSITVGGGSTLSAGLINQGLVTGSGTVQGSLLNRAQVTPGGAGPGILTVDGAFANDVGGVVAIDLGGTAAGADLDQLRVTGNATLNGTLAASLLGDYQPAPAHTFQVMVYGSRAGEFASVTGPGEVTASYNPTDLTLLLGATELAVVSVDPFDGQLEVPVNKTIVVNFSEEIAAGAGFANIALTQNGEPIAATVTLADKSLYIDPAQDLTHKTAHTITIPMDAVVSALGVGQLTSQHVTGFTTINDRILPLWPAGAAIAATPSETALALTWTSATDNVGVTGYRLSVDGTQVAEPATNSHTMTGLTPDKEYTLKVEARDLEGNWTATSITLRQRTLDITAPTWTDANLSVSQLGAGSLRLAWTAAADLGTLKDYVIYQNGQPIATQGAGSQRTYDVKNLDPVTPYTFRVQAKDRAGNESQNGPTVTVTTLADNTAPTFNSTLYLSANNRTTTSLDLTWTAATDDVRVTAYQLFMNGVYYTTVPTNSYQITGLTPGTRYRFSVLAGDAAGHWTTSGPVLERTATLGDVTLPTWPAGAQLSVSNVGNNTATLTWPQAADETWVQSYKLYQTPAGGTTTTYTESATSKSFTSLTPNTTYEFRLEAVDQAGNVGESLYATVLTTVDTQAPTWPAGAAITVSQRTETSLRLNWPAAADNVGVASYRVWMDGAVRTTTGSTYADITGLNPGQSYDFLLEAGDGAGHWTTGPAITTGPLADTKAPTWPNGAAITAANVTETSMDLAWPAANDNVKTTAYRLFVNGEYKTTILPGTGSPITYVLTGLAPSTVYGLKVEAGDEKGNWTANGPTASYVTKGDAEAPTWPAGSSLTYAGLSHDSVLLTWTTAQDNARVSKYEITANGAPVATVGPTVTTYLAKGLTPLTAYTFQVKAGDDNNNWSADGPSVALSTPAQPSPAIPVWGASAVLSAASVGETAVTLVWPAATDDVAVTEYVLSLNGAEIRRMAGGTLTATVDGLLPDRTYRFKVEAADADGHLTTGGPYLEVTTDDNTAPVWAPGAALTAQEVAAGSLRLTWPGATDNGMLTGYRVLQGQLLLGEPGAGTTSFNVVGLAPGTEYTYAVQARDRAGNWTPAGLSVTETTPPDTTAPHWNPVSLAAEAIGETEITLTWNGARDDIAVTGYRLYIADAEPVELTGTTYTATGLTAATRYNFRVEARDAAGNWSTTGPRLAVATAGDDVPPTFPDGAAISVLTVLDKAVTISWPAAQDNLSVKHYVVTANGQTYTPATTALTIDGLTPGATYTITVAAADPSGNQSVQALTVAVTTSIDPTAPTFPAGSAVSFSNVSVTSMRFDWPAANDNIGVTYYRITVNDQVITSTEGGRSHTLTGLRPGTLYQIEIEARDAAGNWSAPLTGEMATPADTTAPVWPGGVLLITSGITENAMTLTWGSATDDVGVTGYRLSFGDTSVLVAGNAYTVTGLTAATVYTFQVEARDEAGNWSATGPSVVMTTKGDHQAPTWPAGSLYVVARTTSSIQLGWTPAADNARVAQYRIYMEDEELVTLGAALGRFTVTGLAEGAAYAFRIEAADDNGNWSADGPTLTASTVDATAPVWPAGSALTATQADQDTVTLTWNAATDNVGVTGYQVFLGDAPVGELVDGLSATVDGLNVTYTYNFRVVARDGAGNPSAGGPAAQITIADVTAPAWNGNVWTEEEGETFVTFAWDAASDNVGVAGYRVSIGDTSVIITERTYTVSGLAPGAEVSITVQPYDAAGNEGIMAGVSGRTRDITAPVWAAGTLTYTGLTETGLTLQWSGAADNVGVVGYAVFQDGVQVGSLGATSYRVSGLSVGQTYTFAVKAVDAAGNWSGFGPSVTVTAPDQTAPGWIGGVLTVDEVTETSAALSWSEAVDNVGVVGYRLFIDGAAVDLAGRSYTATNLTLDHTYMFKIEAYDAAGNVSTNGPTATATPRDEVAPSFGGGQLRVEETSDQLVHLVWDAATDNMAVAAYEVRVGGVVYGSTSGQDMLVAGLSPGATYTFSVQARDGSFNWSSDGPSLTLTMADYGGPVWPSGSVMQVTAVDGDSVLLAWPSVAADHYLVDGVEVRGNSYQVDGLAPGTTYLFSVVAVDRRGNRSEALGASYTTPTLPEPDTAAPVWPGGAALTAVAGETTVTLSWSPASDDVGVVRYVVSGAVSATVEGTSVRLTGLASSTEYTFVVEAVDAAGNRSVGVSVTVQTRARRR
jgi:chitodextrinase